MKKIQEDHKEIASGQKKDDEGYMARIELDSIERAIKNLRKVIKSSDTQLPAWVQSKITRAADFIDTAAEYLQSDQELDEELSGKIDPKKHKELQTTERKQRKAAELSQHPSTNPNVVAVARKKAGIQLPPIQKEEKSLVYQILSEMGCGCNKTKKGKKCPEHGYKDCSSMHEEKDPKGPVQSYKSPEEIAKKHKVPLELIKKQLKMGLKVEKEHTSDLTAARITALQHLDEVPDYYSKLKKVEAQNESKIVRDMFGNVSYEFIDLIVADPIIKEGKKNNPCWDGFKRKKGTKKYEKGSCEPVEEQSGLQQKLVAAKLKKAKAEQEYARTIGTLSKQGADPETVTEATLPAQNGHIMAVTVMWRGKYYATQLFFPQVKLPNRREVTDAVNKIYPESKVITYGVSNAQPGLPIVQLPKSKNYLLNNNTIGEEVEISEAKKSEMPCNKPKAEPVGDSQTGKSHVVKACKGGKQKLIRFGQRGVKGSPKKEGESKAYAKRRRKFKARHAKNIAKGPMSAAYWANRVKW
jgi:hypothetical protein